jgi:hypothetical protein
MRFPARTEGVASIRADPRVFVRTFVRRIETGLLGGASPRRNAYVVTRQGSDGLAFRATNWLTAFNVGLNDVELTISPDRRLHYTIQYRRWAYYALLGCGCLGLVLAGFFLILDIREYVERHAASRIQSLSTGQNVAIAWGMVLFWGLVWPWLLIALHKKPLRRLMDQLVAEVDATALNATHDSR